MKGWLNMLKVAEITKHTVFKLQSVERVEARNKLVLTGIAATVHIFMCNSIKNVQFHFENFNLRIKT